MPKIGQQSALRPRPLLGSAGFWRPCPPRKGPSDRIADLHAFALHGHRAGRQRGQECQKLAAAQLLAKDHRARAVSPMELKDVLGEIEADGADLVHGRLLEWALTPHSGTLRPSGGAHTIRAF